MRIGAIGSNQPLGWRKDKNEPDTETTGQNLQDSGDLAADGVVSTNATLSKGATRASSAGRLASSSSVPGAPSSGTGVGASGIVRTVMWKGKALNMETTRNAPSAAIVDDEAAQSTATAESAIPSEQHLQVLHDNVATMLTGMDEMCGGLQEIYSVLHKISERDTAGERVFNTLHAELSDYKKDFIYEHLKPVVRPLLFLYDSMEQFEEEIEHFDSIGVELPAVEKNGVMPTRVVRQNTVYFREQLVEALRICEVTPMDDPNGVFNPRFHKVIKIVPVEAARDGQVQRVVRSGWFLNGQLLRPAEVEVGKAKS
jgi:molecular chaperone GrpE (heat shock protein)